MDEQKRMNFRYRCKIREIHYDIQLFNLEQEKIKIMIDTKNPYSDEYVEYSNIYTSIHFQEISKYYILFESIEEIFEDLIKTIQEKNFSIKHNGSTITFKITVMKNKTPMEICFVLDRNKTIDLSSQRDGNYYTTISTKNSDMNKYRNNFIEKSKRNIAITDINELNTLLSDFKDRIAVLEQSQNSQINKKETLPTERNMNNIMTSANSNIEPLYDKYIQIIEKKLEQLQLDSVNKDKKIAKLEKKLRYYESRENQEMYENNIGNNMNYNMNNNINNMNNIKTYPKFPIPINSKSVNNKKKKTNNLYHNEYNPYTSRNSGFKTGITLKPNQLKQSKSQFINQDKLRNNTIFNNNDDSSFHSRETKKINDVYNNNINYNNNDQYIDQQTNSMNNDLKSNVSNFSNAKDINFQRYVQYKDKLGIPIVPREDIKKFVNSRIIFTRNELRLLKTKFTLGEKKLHAFFDLLYRASSDGDYEDIVKSKVRNKGRLLTLFYTYEGARFGVYISRKPATSFLKGKIYKEIPGTSFMVSLNNLKFFDILPGKTCKEGEENYLCFGRTFYLNTNASNWIINTPRNNFLKKKCTIGDKGGSYVNLDTEILVGVNEDYHIKDIEIFEVAIERDEDKDSESKEDKGKKKNKKK